MNDVNYTMSGGKMTEKKVKESASQSSKQKLREFQVDDLAVYPAHGVGEIQAIESRVVNGEKHDFYIMKVLENGWLPKITWPALMPKRSLALRLVLIPNVNRQRFLGESCKRRLIKSMSFRLRIGSTFIVEPFLGWLGFFDMP
mgnify:CR=1 FL=1